MDDVPLMPASRACSRRSSTLVSRSSVSLRPGVSGVSLLTVLASSIAGAFEDGVPGAAPGTHRTRSVGGLVDAEDVGLAVAEPGGAPHALERGDDAVPAHSGHVLVDLEGHALRLHVVDLGVDVVDVELGDRVPRLTGEGCLVDVEAGAARGLVDEVDAHEVADRSEPELVGVELPCPGEVTRGDVGLDAAGAQHRSSRRTSPRADGMARR